MNDKIERFKLHVREASANPAFMHHDWFVAWHLELVERISLELAGHYSGADIEMVKLLAWVHDYGKIIDRANEQATTLAAAPPALRACGFDEPVISTLMDWMRIFDNHQTEDISKAPIEVQIVSSADGCAHLTGPFMQVFWKEFADKPYKALMEGNLNKARRDWERKVVLPEAREAFARHYQVVLEQNGALPERFIAPPAA